jgi:hypothetical protein
VTATPWRMCGFDRRQYLDHSGDLPDDGYLCPEHMAAMWAAYDPQPRGEVAIGQREPQSRVRLWTDRISEYIVLARDGDTLTLRRLGFPDDPSIQVPVRATLPADVHNAIVRGLAARKRGVQ